MWHEVCLFNKNQIHVLVLIYYDFFKLKSLVIIVASKKLRSKKLHWMMNIGVDGVYNLDRNI
jgi:hypothetical protein